MRQCAALISADQSCAFEAAAFVWGGAGLTLVMLGVDFAWSAARLYARVSTLALCEWKEIGAWHDYASATRQCQNRVSLNVGYGKPLADR